MESYEYETMFDVEDRHWWYLGLRDLVTSTIARLAAGKTDFWILDAGCGTGKLLEACSAYRIFGLELSADALPFLRRRGLDNVVRGSVLRMPFPDERFNLVVSNDVICCVETPGDVHALREMGRVLREGGSLMLNLPAYEFMRSPHDAAVHTKQRYTRQRLRAMLAQAGFRVAQISYRNTLLFPVAASVRFARNLLGARTDEPKSDLASMPGALNHALTFPLLCENKFLGSGYNLGFGLSVFCVATKS
jgi:SAM-dependent methyltransferase